MNGISFVIPYYNKGETLDLLVAQILELNAHAVEKNTPVEFVIVDDGSRSEEQSKLRTAVEDLKNKAAKLEIKLLQRTVNKGKGATLVEGSIAASHDTLVWVDADVAFETQDVWGIAQHAISKSSSLVVADRSKGFSEGQRWHRKHLSRLFRRMASSVLGLKIRDTQAGLKALPRSWILNHLWEAGGFAIDIEVLRQARRDGLSIEAFPISKVIYRGNSSLQAVKASWELGREILGPLSSTFYLLGILVSILLSSEGHVQSPFEKWHQVLFSIYGYSVGFLIAHTFRCSAKSSFAWGLVLFFCGAILSKITFAPLLPWGVLSLFLSFRFFLRHHGTLAFLFLITALLLLTQTIW